MRILIAPSGLKESVEPLEAVHCIAAGVRQVYPEAEIDGVPVVDGGEGTTKTLVELTGGQLIETVVKGPVGQQVQSFIGILGGSEGPKTAVVEMAAAAGLRLVPSDQRDPQRTTTYGVGQLIKLALEQEGVERILIGCGDSGTNDAGIGCAQALGARFLDQDGNEIGLGAAHIPKLAKIDTSGLHPKLKNVKIDAALNAKNILCGPRSVARVYGPQKGATPAQVEEMAAALDHFASIVQRDVGADVAFMRGGGASGGLGAGLFALLGAHLHARFDIIMEYLGLEAVLERADLILTAEGAIDFQTPAGKVPALLGERAAARGIPVIVLAGMIGQGAEDNYRAGITAYESIQTKPTQLKDAIANGPQLLTDAAARTMRFLQAGSMLNQRCNVSQESIDEEEAPVCCGVSVGTEVSDSLHGEDEEDIVKPSSSTGNTSRLSMMTHFVEFLLCCCWLVATMLEGSYQIAWVPDVMKILLAFWMTSRFATVWQSSTSSNASSAPFFKKGYASASHVPDLKTSATPLPDMAE